MYNMKQLLKSTMPFILLLAIGFSMQFLQSCHKNNYTGSITPYDNESMVVASVMGFVTDESGAVMKDVTVKTGAYTTVTDDNGYFHFDNISTPSHNTTVIVSKNNYFNGSRSIQVNANQKHVVKIGMIAKGIPETFVAANGGNVNFAGGLSIAFPAGAIVNASSGLAYTGQVYVYAKKIDPTTETGRLIMPGDLRGITQVGGEERLLQSFGMMVAELYSVDGQRLQIKSGHEATLSLTVPTSLSTSAPARIPLWYFDEAKGMWIEEGYATLQGGKYIGKVKHFSFWNCDTPVAAIDLELTLVDQFGTPLSGYVVRLINTANNDSRNGITNTSGWVGGLVYPNATLTMEVYSQSNICNISTPIYTQTVVTSSINLNLGTITVPITTPAAATVTGTLIDCSSNAISNGSIVISPYNIVVTPNAAGQFTYTLPCTPSVPVTLYAYDFTNNVYGTSTISLVSGTNTLGAVNACGNVSPFITVNIMNNTTSVGYNYTFNPSNSNGIYALIDSFSTGTGSSIVGYGNNQTEYFTIYAADSTVGTHAVNNVSMYFSNSGYTDTQYNVQSGSTLTYTGFPIFPGDALGNFSMTLVGMPSGNTYTVTGSFRAPRQN